MRGHIPGKIRAFVRDRASGLCEYCLFHEDHSYFPFEVDHIISLKHGGSSDPDNLAYTCFNCNRYKGSDIGSVLLPKMEFTRFYNPRIDRWRHHFELWDTLINPLSPIGEVTVKILDINHIDRVMERQMLVAAGLFPHPNVKGIFTK
jgi:hypothetical protein